MARAWRTWHSSYPKVGVVTCWRKRQHSTSPARARRSYLWASLLLLHDGCSTADADVSREDDGKRARRCGSRPGLDCAPRTYLDYGAACGKPVRYFPGTPGSSSFASALRHGVHDH